MRITTWQSSLVKKKKRTCNVKTVFAKRDTCQWGIKKNNDFNMLNVSLFWRGGGGGAYAAGLSEPLPHYSLFCGQI